MDKILGFIAEYWRDLIYVSIVVIELVACIIALFKRKKGAPLDEVIMLLPKAISHVEKSIGAGNGDQKKLYVIEIALSYYKQLTGVEVTKDSKVYKFISDYIEDILATPQRKEN